MNATIINKSEALVIIGRRKTDRDNALVFLSQNIEIFNGWATDPDRKTGDEWKGVVKLHHEDQTGKDTIKKAFYDSEWDCDIEKVSINIDSSFQCYFNVTVKF